MKSHENLQVKVINNHNEEEKAISHFFNAESKRMAKRHDEKDLSWTIKGQLDDIFLINAKSVIDVGSGPGTVLIELLENGVQVVIGVDLSPEMNKEAKRRLEEKGFTDKQYKLYSNSFLDIKPVQMDAVSLHRVLCCHPDRLSMIEKSIIYQPQIITLTVPRSWLLFKVFLGIFGLFTKITGSFRPYIHSQSKIDQQLAEAGYEIKKRRKGLGWVQTTYSLLNL